MIYLMIFYELKGKKRLEEELNQKIFFLKTEIIFEFYLIVWKNIICMSLFYTINYLLLFFNFFYI